MTRPRLLDLFCGAGGAGMGYDLAGFRVVGVDNKPQPNYPFEFHQADAMAVLEHLADCGTACEAFPALGKFDAIHASPPCQHYANVTKWTGNQADHPDLIGPTRDLLNQIGVPWVIENVRTPEINASFVLCGSMFGLKVIRHRYFESNVIPFIMTPPCRHEGALPFMHKAERAYADAMGCDWMSSKEARQAIPPAYTEWIGRRLLEQLEAVA